jgi:dimethylglycine catabolism B
MAEPLKVNKKDRKLAVDAKMADLCFTCGTCAGGCPVTGIDGFDPRKAIRMAALGLDDELIDSRWPWICTLCGRCENQCPMGINLMKTFRKARGLRERDKVPGPIHKGTMMNLQRGNNLGIPRDDFLSLLADLGQELAHDECPGFYVPVDKKGANIITTINSKEPFGEPDDMKFWWKIFYAAKEDWTVSSTNWEGVNWGLFSGDDPAWKEQVGRVLENARRLECKTLLLPE